MTNSVRAVLLVGATALALGVPRSATADVPIVVSAGSGVNPGYGYGAWSMQPDGTHVRNLASETPLGNAAWDSRHTGLFFPRMVKPPYEVHYLTLKRGAVSRVTHNKIAEFVIDAAPNGHRLAVAAQRSSYGDIYTISLPSGEFRRLTFSPLDDWSPDWSPDGTRIAWVRGDELWVMGGRGQGKHVVADGLVARSPAWSPDGRWIYFADGHGNISRIRPDGSGRSIVVDNDDVWGSGLLAPLWSPDGRFIAFTAARYNASAEEWVNRVYALRVSTGGLTNVTPNLGSSSGAVAVDW